MASCKLGTADAESAAMFTCILHAFEPGVTRCTFGMMRHALPQMAPGLYEAPAQEELEVHANAHPATGLSKTVSHALPWVFMIYLEPVP